MEKEDKEEDYDSDDEEHYWFNCLFYKVIFPTMNKRSKHIVIYVNIDNKLFLHYIQNFSYIFSIKSVTSIFRVSVIGKKKITCFFGSPLQKITQVDA